MSLTLPLLCQIGLLFMMILPGYLMARFRLAPEGFGKGLSNLVLYIAQPALFFVAYVRPFDAEVFQNAIYVFFFSLIGQLFFAAVAFLLYRHTEEGRQKILRFATIFSNAGYMGIPLIIAILGVEAGIYASIYNITFNVLLWSLGVIICTGDKKQASPLRLLCHPMIISAALGIVVFLLPIDGYIPALVIDGLSLLGDLVAPISMIVVGLRLAEINPRGVFRDAQMFIFLLLRLLLLPAAVWGMMKLAVLCGLPMNMMAMTVVLIAAATPAASSTSMFAERFDCDGVYAGKLVAISTLLSALSMPLIAMLLSI